MTLAQVVGLALLVMDKALYHSLDCSHGDGNSHRDTLAYHVQLRRMNGEGNIRVGHVHTSLPLTL